MTRIKFLGAIAAFLGFMSSKLMGAQTQLSLLGQGKISPAPTGPSVLYADLTGTLQTALIGANLSTTGYGGTLTLNASAPAPIPINFVDAEVPAGVVDGTNMVFTLAKPPVVGSIRIYRNGLRLTMSADFTLSSATVTFTSGSQPRVGDVLVAAYRY
jgi:hypothetical protein